MTCSPTSAGPFPRPRRRVGTEASSSRALRGPDPQREDHRATQPSPAPVRSKPDLVPARRARYRAPGLDRDARPDRPRSPPLGTETAALPPLQHPRHHRTTSTPHDPPPERPFTLGRTRPGRDQATPAPSRTRNLNADRRFADHPPLEDPGLETRPPVSDTRRFCHTQMPDSHLKADRDPAGHARNLHPRKIEVSAPISDPEPELGHLA